MNRLTSCLWLALGVGAAAPVWAQSSDPHAHHQGHAESKPAGTHEDAANPGASQPLTPIPEVTAADRAAAFPDLHGHAMGDNAVHSLWLVDRLETSDADGGTPLDWELQGWFGSDTHRLWISSEGESMDGRAEAADLQLLYGHSVSAWWDVVAGVRHEWGDSPDATALAFGVQGMSPYKFEVQAMAYLSEGGQTQAVFEAEYDTLLTNRLILQWQAEMQLNGRDDPQRGLGSGLSSLEAGLRLRYEFSRKFAPYVGVSWERAYGRTADFREADGHPVSDTRIVAGLRFWF